MKTGLLVPLVLMSVACPASATHVKTHKMSDVMLEISSQERLHGHSAKHVSAKHVHVKHAKAHDDEHAEEPAEEAVPTEAAPGDDGCRNIHGLSPACRDLTFRSVCEGAVADISITEAHEDWVAACSDANCAQEKSSLHSLTGEMLETCAPDPDDPPVCHSERFNVYFSALIAEYWDNCEINDCSEECGLALTRMHALGKWTSPPTKDHTASWFPSLWGQAACVHHAMMETGVAKAYLLPAHSATTSCEVPSQEKIDEAMDSIQWDVTILQGKDVLDGKSPAEAKAEAAAAAAEAEAAKVAHDSHDGEHSEEDLAAEKQDEKDLSSQASDWFSNAAGEWDADTATGGNGAASTGASALLVAALAAAAVLSM